MKNILAISGSTRKDSTNQYLIKAITGLTKERFTILPYDRIAMLPHFNPDQMDDAGTEVNDLRELIRQSDAILICTPEYAHGVPGSLKNAIDWTVGTSDFSGKLVMLLTACFRWKIWSFQSVGDLTRNRSHPATGHSTVDPICKNKNRSEWCNY